MATPAYRTAGSAAATTKTVSCTTDTTPRAGDWIFVYHFTPTWTPGGSDVGTTPSSPATTWNTIGAKQAPGTNGCRGQAWCTQVATDGAQVVTVDLSTAPAGQGGHLILVLVLTGVATSPIDGTPTVFSSLTTGAPVGQSVTTLTAADDLLVLFAGAGNFTSSTAISFTAAAGMTERADQAGILQSAANGGACCDTQVLSSAAATGTRTPTPSTNVASNRSAAAVMFAVKGQAAAAGGTGRFFPFLAHHDPEHLGELWVPARGGQPGPAWTTGDT